MAASSAILRDRAASLSWMTKNASLSGFEGLRSAVPLPRNLHPRKTNSARSNRGGMKMTLTVELGTPGPAPSHRTRPTLDPSAPKFLPIPPFEECFPSSTREYKLEDPKQILSNKDTEFTSIDENKALTVSIDQRWTTVKKKLGEITSNARKNYQGAQQVGQSLGVDVGDCKTGVAISLKGLAPRPLSVLHLKGDKLVEELLRIAAKERADEFIVGLPVSFNGEENLQSKKTREVAGRLATKAALRGWRVYLMDEFGSSRDGLSYMLQTGLKKQSRKEKLDAYAALVLLHSYFGSEGTQVKLVVPKGLACQEQLCLGNNLIADDCYDYFDD